MTGVRDNGEHRDGEANQTTPFDSRSMPLVGEMRGHTCFLVLILTHRVTDVHHPRTRMNVSA